MAWELVIFAGMGAFVVLWYGLREFLVWRDAQQRWREVLLAYRHATPRPNIRRVAR